MRDSDKQQFIDLMQDTCDYYGKEAKVNVFSMYFNGLRQFSFEQVQQAMNLHLVDQESGQYFPKVADLIRHLHGNKKPVEIRNEQVAAEWLRKKQAEIANGGSAFQFISVQEADDALVELVR